LLASLQLASPHGMRAVSLQERQMECCASASRTLERKIMEMIRYGQDNMAISDRLHRWTRTVMLTHDLERLEPVLVRDLQHQFQIRRPPAHLGASARARAPAVRREVSDDVKIFATAWSRPTAGHSASSVPAGSTTPNR